MVVPFLDWLAVFNFLGAAQGIFLALIFIVLKKGNRRANLLLGITLLVLVFIVLEITLGYTGYIRYIPIIINFEEPTAYLIGPLTYFYTRALLRPDKKVSWQKDVIHFIPFLLQALGRVPFYLQSNEYKIQDNAGSFHHPIDQWIPAEKIMFFPEHDFLTGVWLDIVSLSIIIAYHTYSISLVLQHLKKCNESLRSISDSSLRWLIWVMASFSILLFGVVFFSFFKEDDLGDIYVATCCSFVFYSTSFYLISHLQASASGKQVVRKYENSSLDETMKEEIVTRLDRHIRQQKPYLNSEISMPVLAEQLHISPHHLSQVINEQHQLNFSDFINRMRVEEMKLKLGDPKYYHYKIEQIAYETGFNSKSTFQTAFKKFTGLTPSQYKQKLIKTRLKSI